MTRPDISIVIVSLNVRDLLKANLERLFGLGDGVTREVIVIDNASEDGSRKMVRAFFPQVQLIANDTNRGFAAACNQGLRIAQGKTLLLFNPDMLAEEGVLEQTHRLLHEQPDIGVLGVQLRQDDGQRIVPSVRCSPSFGDQLAILLKLPHVFKRMTSRYLATDFDYSFSQDVEQVRGSYFAFRRELLDIVGLLDERYFIWFEEVDYCNRVREAGYRIRYCADVSCRDLVGQTFKQQSTVFKQRCLSQSMVRYFLKWHPKWQAGVLWLLRPYAIAAGFGYDVWRKRTRT